MFKRLKKTKRRNTVFLKMPVQRWPRTRILKDTSNSEAVIFGFSGKCHLWVGKKIRQDKSSFRDHAVFSLHLRFSLRSVDFLDARFLYSFSTQTDPSFFVRKKGEKRIKKNIPLCFMKFHRPRHIRV